MGGVHFLPALLLVLILLSQSASALSTQKQPRRPSPHLSLLPPPTPEDEATEQLYIRQGILMGEMKLRTTPASVAGRGVFLDAPDPKNVGHILGYVPWRAVLTQANAALQYPDLHNRLSGSDHCEQLGWPGILAAYAHHALEDEKNNPNYWSDFIKCMEGGHPTFLSRQPGDFGEEELQSLAYQARSSPDQVRKLLEIRSIGYQRQSQLLREALSQHDEEAINVPSNLYEAVLSRAISLTEFLKDGSNKRHHCLVPLHDMINHNNDAMKNNVAMYNVAAIRRMAPVDLAQINSDVELDVQALDERDLCVVAIQPISPGGEVFNSYNYEDQGRLTEEVRVWKLLQYGFPME